MTDLLELARGALEAKLADEPEPQVRFLRELAVRVAKVAPDIARRREDRGGSDLLWLFTEGTPADCQARLVAGGLVLLTSQLAECVSALEGRDVDMIREAAAVVVGPRLPVDPKDPGAFGRR